MITLVLGGTRSGKSAVAERLVPSDGRPVTYVATAVVGAGDHDMAARVARHRARRPAAWVTVEAGADLPGALRSCREGSLLVDSLGAWVAATPDLAVDADDLCAALRERSGDSVVVSEEVGLGVHPATEVGRRFADVLGAVNQRVAAVADEALLVVAGRVLPLR